MAKIYTKTGDHGETSLVGGERVPKTDVRVEAYGTVDELGAHIALLDGMLSAANIENFHDELVTIARDLMQIESMIAVGDHVELKAQFDNENIKWLEELIDNLTETLPPLNGFVLPMGNALVGECHVCRTVCRRSERNTLNVTDYHNVPEDVLTYLNRLSDYLFILSRKVGELSGAKEILWQ
ncbi:MAG: cob(I)yrinic acid a,c-diamide adenosyltransferase [Tidjanibacter sp.]|nr:cob(I)yrinic acid a,c-diamide adenosyltransferase [Tidjanibacter sp.]